MSVRLPILLAVREARYRHAGNRYLEGSELYGEALDEEQVVAWFEDEREAYADLGVHASSPAEYEQHAFNEAHGFRHLRASRFRHALGLGSALGGEFQPLSDRIERLTIVEPSMKLRALCIGPLVPEYTEPQPSGALPFADAEFDLIVCLGVLHHVAKVSFHLKEISRVLCPGGQLLLREPIVSLGDWEQQRPAGLTRRERGIPKSILGEYIYDADLIVDRQTLCDFPLIRRVPGGYGSRACVRVDALLSRLTRFNYRYHAANSLQKVRPTGAFYVISKPGDVLS